MAAVNGAVKPSMAGGIGAANEAADGAVHMRACGRITGWLLRWPTVPVNSLLSLQRLGLANNSTEDGLFLFRRAGRFDILNRLGGLRLRQSRYCRLRASSLLSYGVIGAFFVAVLSSQVADGR